MAIHVLVGAAFGAVLGAGVSIGSSLLRGKPIDWKSVGAAALGGAAAGAITSLTFGAGAPLAGTAMAKVGGMTLAGAAGGFTEQSADNLLHEREWSEGVARSTAEGAAVGAVAGVVRVAARPVATFLARNPTLKRAVSRRAAKELAKPLRRLIDRYRASMATRPRSTQALTGGAMAAAGDLIAQTTDDQPGIDWRRLSYRSLWAAGFGATAGWTWTTKLDRWFPSRTWGSTLKKTALDQAVMVPASTVPFFMGYGMAAEGESPREAWERTREKAPETWALSLKVWPAFTAARFKWVPVDLQPLVSRVMGLAYNVMFARTAFDEDEEEKRIVDRPLGEDGPEAPDEAAPPVSRDPLERGSERLERASERALERGVEGLIDLLADAQ